MASNIPSFPTVTITDLNDPAIRTWWDSVTKFLNTSSLNDDSFGGTGVLVRQSAGNYSARTITAGTGMSVTNGSGINGDPTINLSIPSLTTDVSFDSTTDTLAVYDASTGIHKQGTISNIINTLLPGKFVQAVSSSYTTHSSTATTIPLDDTIPQNTEGVQLTTVSITPQSASSNLIILANVWCANSTALGASAAIFQDSTADAIAASCTWIETVGAPSTIPIHHVMTAGSTASTTFALRAGPSTGTLYFNGIAAGRLLGGVGQCVLTVIEIAP